MSTNDIIQPLIGVLSSTNNNSNNKNTQQQQSSASSSSNTAPLPSRDVVVSYLRKKPVAATLDTIVTELFSKQPEDPERHLLEFLLKRNPQVALQQSQQPQQQQPSSFAVNNNNSNTTNNNSFPVMARQESGGIVAAAPGDGTAPRTLPGVNGLAMTRRRSVTNGNNNTNNAGSSNETSNTTGTGASSATAHVRSGTPPAFSNSTSSQHQLMINNVGGGVAQTNLQAEELLQWILDVTDPSYVSHNNLHHTHLVGENTNKNNSNSDGSSASSPVVANHSLQQTAPTNTSGLSTTATGNVKVATSNYTIRVPPGLESHPLASRCRQLATRYHATTAELEVDDDSDAHTNNNNRGENIDRHENNNKQQSSAVPPHNSITTGLTTTTNNNNNNNPISVRVTSPTKINTSFTREFSNATTSGPTSPSIFSPAALNQLREAYNLSEENHGHLLLAVTDAMRIVLDWAGDALLVAENLARVVKLLVNGERCTVFVADERSQTLRTVIDGKNFTVKFGQGIVGRCATQKKPLVVNNAYAHPSFEPKVDGEVNYVTRNVLSMPMIVEGKLIAVVQVLNKQDSDFSEIDVEIFKAFTTVAGIVIRDAMTFPLTMRNLELAEGAKELCVRMMNVNMLSEKQAAMQWATMLRGYLGSDCCTILRVQCNESPEGPGRIHITPDQLDLTFVASDSAIDFGGFQPLPQKAIIAAALTNKAPELVNNALRDHRFDKQAARLVQSRVTTSSLLVVPAFPFGDSDGSCNHYLSGSVGVGVGNGVGGVGLGPSGNYYSSAHHHHRHHQQQQGNYYARPLFCCYIVQFENFKETPIEIATTSNNNNNTRSPTTSSSNNNHDFSNRSNNQLNSSTEAMMGGGQDDTNSVSSANDIIFADEAIEHVGRILPFFESVLRSMNLIHAQRHQSALLHETARSIGHLCDEKMDINDAFDLLSRTIEGMIQRDTRRGSVLFYTKVDSEGIESMQLLPRASLGPIQKNNNNNNTTATASAHHANSTKSTTTPTATIIQPVPPSSPPPNQQSTASTTTGGPTTEKVHQHRTGQTFRLRRRSSVSHLAFNNIFQNEIKIPIGFGIVGTAVAGVGPVYFSADEANELYSEGEFGPLVAPNEFPNCPVLVVPLADNRTLLGAMIILRPRGDIIERVMDILGFGFGNPTTAYGHQGNGSGPSSSSSTAAGSTVSATTLSAAAALNKNQYGSFAGPFMQSSYHAGSVGLMMNANGTATTTSPANNILNNTTNGGNGTSSGSPSRYGSYNYQIDRNFDWTTVTSDQLVQPARIDFLSTLVSVAKYVLKASSQVQALARQQESLLFSGELERLAMPITNQASATKTGSGSNLSRPNNNNSNEEENNGGGAASSSINNNNNNPAIVSGGAAGSNRLLSTTNFSQLLSNFPASNNNNNNNNNNGGGSGAGENNNNNNNNPLPVEMFDKLSSTSFPIFDFVDGQQSPAGLVVLTLHMFRSLNCLNELNIDEGMLMHAILKSFRRYRDVPYHNVYHAFDVTQSLFYFMKMAKLDEAFLPSERFAILLAAVFHDIDHNGLNNAYHAKAETPFGVIASLSGQKSVLEYHHCQVAIDVINSLQLLRHTSEEDRRRVLRMFFQCILGTDMALHREIQQSIQATFLGDDGVTRCFDPENLEHRDLCAKMLLKMADISNPVKDFSLARRWALSVTEEFYRQGDVERLEGHQVQPMFDRHLNAELSKGQIGFITFMAQPFFNLAAKCFPVYEELTKNMDNNLSRWRKVEESNRVISTNSISKVE